MEKKQTKETKLKISNSLKGHIGYPTVHNEETKKKISDKLKNRPKSEEHKRKISESLIGKPSWSKNKSLVKSIRKNYQMLVKVKFLGIRGEKN